jgi:RecA-family ATPase
MQPPGLKLIDPTTFNGPPPSRHWIWPDWIPIGCVTAIYGDGGCGKSLFALQLMTSCAASTLFLGQQVTECRTIGLFCEDDEAELHRRLEAICAAAGLPFSALRNMRLISGVGEDNTLIRFPRPGAPAELTPRYHAIVKAAREFGAKLVIIDGAADTFGGNENDRQMVRQYIGLALTQMARDIDGAVVLLAHPSRAGLQNGDNSGGSTGWNNSVRSRISLAHATKGDAGGNGNGRLLRREKSNYAGRHDEIRLVYGNGVLRALGGPTATPGQSLGQVATATFLACLDEATAANRPASDSTRAGNYAPKLFAKFPKAKAEGLTKEELAHAMEALFAAGEITMQSYGKPSAGTRRIVRALGAGNGGNGSAPLQITH